MTTLARHVIKIDKQNRSGKNMSKSKKSIYHPETRPGYWGEENRSGKNMEAKDWNDKEELEERVQELLNSEYELKKMHLLEMERALRMKDDLIRYFSGDPAYDWNFLMEAFDIPEPIATELWDRVVKRAENLRERGL